jgi:hypothetical protein
MGIVGLLFWSAIILVPGVAIVSKASRLRSPRNRLTRLAPLAVVIGFLAGGIVGWASVPAQWTASFWTTVEAAGNAAKYGHAFEHTAERALMYFLYPALLGEVAFGLAALLVVWRIGESRPHHV